MKILKQADDIGFATPKLSKSQNQQADFLRFLLTEDSLKIKKNLKLVSMPHFL